MWPNRKSTKTKLNVQLISAWSKSPGSQSVKSQHNIAPVQLGAQLIKVIKVDDRE